MEARAALSNFIDRKLISHIPMPVSLTQEIISRLRIFTHDLAMNLLHRLCKGFAPVGTCLVSSSSPNGEGAIARGSGAMGMNADVRAASTDSMKVDPRNEVWMSAAMRSHGPSSPPAAGFSRRREQQTIARRSVHRWCKARNLSPAVVEEMAGRGYAMATRRGARVRA